MRLALKLGWKITVTVLVIVLLALAWRQLPMAEWIDQFRNWIVEFGALGVVAFIALYIVITVMLGPASALTLTAGLAYGPWGFPLVLGSATLAAIVAFVLGRYVARERVSRWVSRDARLRALNAAFSDQGWRVVGLMRLSPIIPYGVQNYLFSVTQITFIPYVLATLVGIMPATALYVYIGSLGRVVGAAGTLQWVLVLAGLLATLGVAWVIGRKARLVLANQVDESLS